VSGAPRVIVLGGGLAGITAALDCAEAGASVQLLEVRRRLGGAAYSVTRDGLEMDNGQHVFLRGCFAYRGLLQRLGSEHLVSVQPRLEIPVLTPGRRPYVLRRSSLPAPLHLAGALARYPHLSLPQRLGAARAALALMRLGMREREEDGVTLGEWLYRHGQGPEAIAALWDLIALPTLNLPAAQASLSLGAFVFQNGLFSTADAGDIGFHVGTLGAILSAPAARALREAGVEVRLGWRAQRVSRSSAGLVVHALGTGGADDGDGEHEDGRAAARDGTPADTELDCDRVIVALPPSRAAGVLEPLLGTFAARFRRLGASPIVNLHVVYDREVCGQRFAAGVGTPVQYLFDRTAAAGAPAGCQYLAISLSGAEREMRMSVQQLRTEYLPALERLLPRARGANVESFLVTREHAATFRATPGVAALRPGPETAVPGVLLAGTWTATEWPATLESAVLSGHAAAAAALAAGRSGRERPTPGAAVLAAAGAPGAAPACGREEPPDGTARP
jgi:squalene-associated FAD-dependent desaturase